ncbi:hypothetical protein AAC387_Pa09g1055 [Persea americana]
MDATEETAGLAFHMSTNKATMEEKTIKHYSSSHRILLVGEGDFSFSACLARAFGSANNMVATSLDSRAELEVKYLMAGVYLEEIGKLGCKVFHGVDAHTMAKHPDLSFMEFDRIVFIFPHSRLGYPEHDLFQISLHEQLVEGFFKSAGEMLSSNGEIHVTHKTAYPFSLWRLEELASELGLILLEEANFYKSDYPGYDNKRAYNWRDKTCDSTFPVGECSTFKFVPLKIG